MMRIVGHLQGRLLIWRIRGVPFDSFEADDCDVVTVQASNHFERVWERVAIGSLEIVEALTASFRTQ